MSKNITTHSFNYIFADQACRVELLTAEPKAVALFHRYDAMFPAFRGNPDSPPRYTLRIHDLALRAASLSPADAIFPALREYLETGYPGLNPDLVKAACSPAFVPDAAARDWVAEALADTGRFGLSVQKDFLVRSDRGAGQIEAFADVGASVKEAWAFHVLNFFKIPFFAAGAVRLHGSGATAGDRAILFLANTGGGKSTMKNFFLQAVPGPIPFTDDSILAFRGDDGFRLYQDPVEFMRWCYMDPGELPQHVIPTPRPAIRVAPAIYYLSQGEPTSWKACDGEAIFDKVNAEAFFQKGFLTQRFIPQPNSDTQLQAYFENTRRFLSTCRCHLATVKHHDDYRALFRQWSADLGIGEA